MTICLLAELKWKSVHIVSSIALNVIFTICVDQLYQGTLNGLQHNYWCGKMIYIMPDPLTECLGCPHQPKLKGKWQDKWQLCIMFCQSLLSCWAAILIYILSFNISIHFNQVEIVMETDTRNMNGFWCSKNPWNTLLNMYYFEAGNILSIFITLFNQRQAINAFKKSYF